MKAGERDARSLVRELGMTLLDFRQGGSSHFKGTMLTPKGNTLKVTFPQTPSDWRGMRNQRAWMRRRIKELDNDQAKAP